MKFLVRPLISVTTYRRWTFLLGGTAILVPYLLIYAGLLRITNSAGRLAPDRLLQSLVMLLAYIGVSSAVAFIPAVRILSRTAVETLLDVQLPAETVEGMRSWRSRRRTAVWWVLHIGVGGGTGLVAVVAVPVVPVLLRAASRGDSPVRELLGDSALLLAGVSVLLGLLILPLIVSLGAAVGAVLARLAPALLGPSPADRLVQLERRAEQLIERNRLARELHDSIGHALTVTTLQAGAAVRLLDTDPEFARRALSAIEETGRTALEDLDHVLGLLREDPSARTPQRTLADVEALVEQTRSAGAEVRAEVGPTDGIPAVVSREAYRILQEALTNVLRHAGKVPVDVRIGVCADRLELEVANPLGPSATSRTGAAPRTGVVQRPGAAPRSGGGSGLRGVRERVALLGGRSTAGLDGARWRVHVTIPVVPLLELERR
ncbi:sensor histidine kinase [Actinoallomurus rhizosphaericola]|uniref:sensor histidine kinase n=1 Tax=Actinoallomurus rhizosphaericola TaxID=2952536 RepID=UPI0020926B8D|nr:histidine kinase [Actinoallomurus rhizosphaericola]MCO5995177.1 histidine kinase [Actinoallomurus rhizosphaericola]